MLKILGWAAAAAAGLFVAAVVGTLLVMRFYVPNKEWKREKLMALMRDGGRPHRDRWYAAAALAAQGRESTLAALPYLLVSDAPLLQEQVPQALLSVGPEAVPALVAALQAEDREAREAGAFWLGALARACPEAAEGEKWATVIECRPVKSSCSGVMSAPPEGCAAWRERVRAGLVQARRPLRAALKDADRDVRLAATRALSDLD